jgi:hypothetical protein
MKRKRYDYTIEKLTNTLEILATHPGDVRERLTDAFLSFQTLRNDDFPLENRKDWDWVLSELTKYRPLINNKGEVWRGSIENTMRRVQKSTASKIAKQIYKLYWIVSENKQYR